MPDSTPNTASLRTLTLPAVQWTGDPYHTPPFPTQPLVINYLILLSLAVSIIHPEPVKNSYKEKKRVERTDSKRWVWKKKRIDLLTATQWQWEDALGKQKQELATIIFSIKRTCVHVIFDVENRGHSEPLSTAFADNCVWQNTSSKRSTDRAQRLVVYHFRSIGNVVRMSKPIVFFCFSLGRLKNIHTDECSWTWFMHITQSSFQLSWEAATKGQWHQCSNPPRGVLVVSHAGTHTHCYGNQQECEHASGLKG